MEARSTACVWLLGANDSLSALLRDVFAEDGLALHTGEAGAPRADLVLVHIQRGESVLGALQSARDGTYPAPVFVLVPFADERLIQLALRLGARGCFALGQPLDELRRMVCAVIERQGNGLAGQGPAFRKVR
ncbi:DNA-binding response regulator [Hyalangium rubrum]|uniref:DNA-binding response regulator n=1 Tax=Hyalangium rubrum TaxID=3103134 RepID=A0ABU5H848_9BACT|nr:DNA-binding response regulator [Hyalangium sp. s54d21]MDY7229638.1 DNA-binding response regulator [Hyalangium sp. s54d21]